MTDDAGVGVGLLQTAEEVKERELLGRRAGVGGIAAGIESPFVADAQ